MAEIIESVGHLPIKCREAAERLLSENIRNSEIFASIVLEVYNGWRGDVGEERVIDVIKLIAHRIPKYAKVLGMPELEYLTLYAKARKCNYVNWFQDSYLPDIDEKVLVFENEEAYLERFPSRKFVCCCCGGITTDYQECNSGKEMAKGKICDWKVYGLFGDLGKGIRVLFKSRIQDIPKPVVMFRPVELE